MAVVFKLASKCLQAADKTGEAKPREHGGDTSTLAQVMSPPKFILDPRSAAMKKWDQMTAILLIFTATVTPYEVGFLVTSLETVGAQVLFYMNRIIDVAFFLDLLFNFRLAYFDPNIATGVWVFDERKISYKYLGGMFFWDFISVLPFGCIGIFVDSEAINNLKILRVVRLLRLVKLQRILRTGKLLKQVEDTMAINYNLMTLVKFIVLTLFIAHWLACGWHLVVRFEGGEMSWVSNYFSNWVDPYEDPGAFSKYIAALYWAFVTMSTIGYGDVVPTTDAERFFEIVAMLCGTSVFAYVVGSVCTIVGNMDRKNGEFFELMDSLNAFMADLKLNAPLRVKLRQYFHYRRRSAIFGGYQGLLGLMSPELQGDVAVEQCGDWVNKVPFFRNAPAPFIASIAKALQTKTFPQGEDVIQVSSKVESLYIVQRGVVGGRGRLFTSGKVFGQDILAGEGCATYTATALSFTDLYGLLRDDLEETLQQFPKMKHRLQKAGRISVAKEAMYAFTTLWKKKVYGNRLAGNASYIEDLLGKSEAE
eukprot:gene4820-5888_t